MTKAQEKAGRERVDHWNRLELELADFDGPSWERKQLQKDYDKAERELKKYFLKAGKEVFESTAGDLCLDWETFADWAKD